jgi:hypothetical protein
MEPVPRFKFDPAMSVFRLEGHNHARPFSGFLPAIAGEWGVPAWAFYVSRGQALAGAGAGDRAGQILELYSFNKACTRVEMEGFRTFLRLDGANLPEPFRRRRESPWHEALEVTPAEIRLEAVHAEAGIRLDVTYFILPGRRLPGIVRDVSITDLSGSARTLEVLDGTPRLLPHGLGLHGIKTIPRHIEAMAVTERPDDGIALYRLAQVPSDDASVASSAAAHFLRSWAAPGPVSLVVDPAAVFSDHFAFDRAIAFEDGGAAALRDAQQVERGRTPCGFTLWEGALDAHESVRIVSVLGRTTDGDLTGLEGLGAPAAWNELRKQNLEVIDRLADTAFTVSDRPVFDAYCRQNALDDIIRGGAPLRMGPVGPVVYAFSHQNFDLERDYHDFVVTPTYLSAGIGHFRNTLQNRRNDVFFEPASSEENLRIFFNLLQLDGYNPLEVRPQTYTVADPTAVATWVEDLVEDDEARRWLLDMMESPFLIGELAMWLEQASGVPAAEHAEALGTAIGFLAPEEIGAIHAGYWVDHWRYLLDLAERHFVVFPDQISQTLLAGGYTWFDDPDVVAPRRDRYRMTPDGPRQLGAVVRDEEKQRLIASRDEPRHRACAASGALIHSTLAEKLVLLAATRLATLDPAGLGIEMEAGKPGWNDSLNGLPGLFGSCQPESLELRRALRLVDRWLADVGLADLDFYEELADLLDDLALLVDERVDGTLTAFLFWDRATSAKETYRRRIRLHTTGRRRTVSVDRIRQLCQKGIELLDLGLRAGGRRDDGLPHTFFTGHPTLEETPEGPVATGFEVRPIEPFLEGAVHWMREFPEDAASVHAAVRASALYDRDLEMYRSSIVMDDADPALGRAVGAYPPGWLEHASIYTHMEYKYLLEMLRSGLVREFWEDAEQCLVPFLDPATYGRSPIEGSSFIVSSAHPDPAEHGRGYQPRLSGMTAEFNSIWIEAALGSRPFRVGAGGLVFAPEPRLPGRYFTTGEVTRTLTTVEGDTSLTFPAGTFACRAVAGTVVRYLNPTRADTFGPDAVSPERFEVAFTDGRRVTADGPFLVGKPAAALRRGEVFEVVIRLGTSNAS